MKIIFVDTDKTFSKEFEESFKRTNRVTTFPEMFEAYKWMKADENTPDIIVTEIDLYQPTGLQSLKFLLTKSKLKNTYIVGFTQHSMSESEKKLILSEGASEVFEKNKLVSGFSAYLKFLSDPNIKQKSSDKKFSEKGKSK